MLRLGERGEAHFSQRQGKTRIGVDAQQAGVADVIAMLQPSEGSIGLAAECIDLRNLESGSGVVNRDHRGQRRVGGNAIAARKVRQHQGKATVRVCRLQQRLTQRRVAIATQDRDDDGVRR